MEIVSRRCVNSRWTARFLADDDQEACECFGSCKVRVKDMRGYEYILTEDEVANLEYHEVVSYG